jgi:hypothetical protein
MSIKRTKQRSFRRREDEVSFTSFNSKGEEEPEKSWEEQVANQPEEAFLPYSLQSTLTKGALVSHPKFGKGVVVGVEAQRADVLFADGKKKLGHRLP